MFQAQSRQVFEFTEIDEIYPALLNLRRPTLPSDWHFWIFSDIKQKGAKKVVL
jgi:hypothetical protein